MVFKVEALDLGDAKNKEKFNRDCVRIHPVTKQFERVGYREIYRVYPDGTKSRMI